MKAADTDATTDGPKAAWWPALLAGALALAVFAVAAMVLAPWPRALDAAQLPADSVGWLRPEWVGQPAHWFQGVEAGALRRLPRDRSPVQLALLLSRRPDGDSLLYLPAAAGEPEVFVNGASVPTRARVGSPYPAAPRMRPVRLIIPAQYFRPGANRVDAVFVDVEGPVLMAAPLFGDEARIEPAAARSSAWIDPLRRIAMPLAFVATLLALAAATFSTARGRFLGLAAAMATVGCRLLLADPLASQWQAASHMPLGSLLLAAGLASLACAAWHRPRARAVADSPGPAWMRLGIGAAIALTAAATAVAAYEAFSLYSGSWMPRLEAFHGLCVVALAAALAIVSAWVAGRDAMRFARARLDLARTVRRQQIEIEGANRALEAQMRRAAILEERQRLARDVHDGVGGTLASLLARIRMRRIGIEQIEGELVGGLADLRLIVDSMDAAGESLAATLAAFRARIAPQVEQAGLWLHWEQPEELAGGTDDPQWVLHLYRVMQEAVNNAIRHSGGQALRIAVRPVDGRRLRVEIVDDGAWTPPLQDGTGRGLSNMAWRARQLGGDLQVEPASATGGTRVRVDVAMPASGAGQSRGAISPS